ncbi:MAG: hypothetical protein IT223_10870, partial [Crocinitomicaceae bacterium]|nr:hypothetical protein [Crocinitomicaceae bacterium]
MRRPFFALVVFFSLFLSTFAQQNPGIMTPQDYWKYSPDLSEEELYTYDRLLYMSREDWELFRHDPRYSEERTVQLYRENKGKVQLPPGQLKMMTDECNCWLEPDNTYITEDPVDWTNCGGGGAGVDCWIGPINLPFNFCFYGQNFNQIYLTSKGTIAFGSGYIDWTPSEFPNPVNPNDPQYDHVCGFWADFDFRQTGLIKYKVTSDAFYINYLNVGHWANHGDKTNTFQMILTAPGSDVIPGDKNVQFCYKDMQWAHGDIGGSGGFAGPTPANVGADRVSGSAHIQFGRFNLPNATYNGPYGQSNNQQDGINWLDNKVFDFNVCNIAANQKPLATVSVPCDTIFLCIGDVYNLGMQFLSPESGQVTSINYQQSGTGLTASATSGNIASLNATFTASANNLGANTVTITATDNGNPAASSTLTYLFFVQNIQVQPIAINGTLTMCAGGETILTASPGFDEYNWSTGCDMQACTIDHGGTITVTGYLDGCASTASVTVDASSYFIPELESHNEPIVICPGTTAQICTVEQWASYSWDVYPGYPGSIPQGSATDQQCLTINGNTAGHYRVTVEDESGCQGFNIQLVEIIESCIDTVKDNNIGAYCDGMEPVSFTGGYSNP